MLHSSAPARRAVGIAVLVVALQALMVTAFAWPATDIAPRDLPVVVAGPAPAAEAFAKRLGEAEPGAFEVTTVTDATIADQRLRDRDAYGAFLLGPDGLAAVHLASAASPVAAQLLGQVAQVAGQGRRVPVADVVPAAPGDPRGIGLATALLPLVLTSLVAGLLLALAVRGRWARALGVVAYAGLAGLAVTAIIQYGLDALPGDFLANAAVVALLALAMGAAVTGLGAVLGTAGIGLAVLLVLFVGNPLSGLTSAAEMLPQPWGAIGQLLPPGAGGTLLRSVASFDGAGAALPAWVLGAWAGGGLLLAVATASSRLRLAVGRRGSVPPTRLHQPV
ncbi:MAG TPA: hypothetical protein VFA46_13075 [Actinomycetes bacterium]|jgi:hypothetical protein|nr:hypothetical protein [Actinomycetes bacterium]